MTQVSVQGFVGKWRRVALQVMVLDAAKEVQTLQVKLFVVQEDGLAEDNIGDLGGDDVGDIYKYGNAVPNSFCDFTGLCCGISTCIRLLDGDTGRQSSM